MRLLEGPPSTLPLLCLFFTHKKMWNVCDTKVDSSAQFPNYLSHHPFVDIDCSAKFTLDLFDLFIDKKLLGDCQLVFRDLLFRGEIVLWFFVVFRGVLRKILIVSRKLEILESSARHFDFQWPMRVKELGKTTNFPTKQLSIVIFKQKQSNIIVYTYKSIDEQLIERKSWKIDKSKFCEKFKFPRQK